MLVFANHSHKHSQTIVTGFTICLLLIMLSACASTYDKMDKLNSTLRGYEKALRWAKFEMAYSFHKWDTEEQPSIPEYLKNIRLTSYSASNQNFNEDKMTATQSVSIRYYNQNNLRERSLEDKQRWKYFSDKKRWYLISKPPTFE